MICKECKHGADYKSDKGGDILAVKRYWHNKCKGGTWCDCQHRVGRKNVQ